MFIQCIYSFTFELCAYMHLHDNNVSAIYVIGNGNKYEYVLLSIIANGDCRRRANAVSAVI